MPYGGGTPEEEARMPAGRPSEDSPTAGHSGQQDAHILFLDVVAFSRLSDEEQAKVLTALPAIVHSSVEYREANNRGEVLSLPRGDGVALVFLGDIFPAVRTAIDIAQELRAHHRFQVRMGLNSGPVAIVRDINDSMDVAGDGIVGAHRAMEAGDAGHILLTERTASMVLARKAWAPYLHDLGVIPVKHGIPLRLYSLHTPEVGNPSPPRALLQHYARIAENKRSRAVARPRTWRDAAGDAAKVGWLTLLAGTSLLAVLFAVSAQFRDTVLTTYFRLTHSGPRPRIIQCGPTATVSGAAPLRGEQGAARSRSSDVSPAVPDPRPENRQVSDADGVALPPSVQVRMLEQGTEPGSEQRVEIVVRVARDGLGVRPVRVECGPDLDSLTVLGEREEAAPGTELRYETNHVGERMVVAVTYFGDQRHFLGTWSLTSGSARRIPDG